MFADVITSTVFLEKCISQMADIREDILMLCADMTFGYRVSVNR